MRDSLIIRDYCSIMSFQAEVDALDTKVGHIRWCAGDAVMHRERGEAGGTDWCVVFTVRTPASLRPPALAVLYIELLGVFLSALAGDDKKLSMEMEDCLFPEKRGRCRRSRHEPASPLPSAELLPFPCTQVPAPQGSAPGYTMAGVAGR